MEASNLLAGMGILTDDDELVDAALSGMVSLPLVHGADSLLVRYHLGKVSDVGLGSRFSFVTYVLSAERYFKSTIRSPEGGLNADAGKNPSQNIGFKK